MKTKDWQAQDAEKGDRPWVQVADTVGSAQTAMVLKYLHANDLHAVGQESSSIALLTGANSVARILVPEAEVGRAMALLEPEAEVEGEAAELLEENESESYLTDRERAVLGAMAVIFNPVGAGVAYILAGAQGESRDDVGFGEADCPICGTALVLSEEEVARNWFTCPECEQTVTLDDFVVCPACECSLELDQGEREQGWFICPDCRRAVRIARGQ